jgi:tetratricopeptide (TPR) repeat protein
MKDRGNLHFTQVEYAEAAECYRKALEMHPDAEFKLVLHSNSAECYLKLRNYLQAEAEASSALTLNPSHTKSLLRRARALKMLGRFKHALADLDAAIAIDSSNPALLTERGQVTKRQAKANRLVIEAMVQFT